MSHTIIISFKFVYQFTKVTIETLRYLYLLWKRIPYELYSGKCVHTTTCSLPMRTHSHSVQWWPPFSTEIALKCQTLQGQVDLLWLTFGNSSETVGDLLAHWKQRHRKSGGMKRKGLWVSMEGMGRREGSIWKRVGWNISMILNFYVCSLKYY